MCTRRGLLLRPGHAARHRRRPDRAPATRSPAASSATSTATPTTRSTSRCLRRAAVYGSVMASFAIEDFGSERLERLTHARGRRALPRVPAHDRLRSPRRARAGAGEVDGVPTERSRTRAPGYRHVESLLAARALRDPRRWRRDRGAAPVGPRRPTRQLWGTWRALPGARDGPRRAPRAPRRRLQRALDRDVVDPLGARGRAGRAPVGRRPEPLDRHRAPGHPARPQGDGRGGARGRDCAVAFAISEEVNSPRRRETIELLARMFADDPPDLLLLETLTLIRDPADVRDGRAAARDRAAGLALVPPLPPRRLRRLRPALGPARGRPLRPRRAALRGDGRRGAADQLPAGRPRAGHRLVAARLHGAAARRLPEPRPPGGPALALRRHDRPGGLRRARARLARGGRADHRRLLRRDAGPHRGARPRARGHEARPPPPARSRTAALERVVDAQRAARAVARRARRRPVSRCRCRSSRSRTGVFVPTHGSFLVWKHLFQTRRGRRACAASTSAAAAGIQTVQLALNGADARACDRHRPQRDREHGLERVPQRRRRPRERRRRRPLPVGPRTSATTSIVASLYQMPVDPYEEPSGHRPLDYWGRNQLDHFLGLLPRPADRRRPRARDAALDRRAGGDLAAASRARA